MSVLKYPWQWTVLLVLTTTLSQAQVVINEVMANNVSAVSNGKTHPDWVELYNRGTTPVSLSGMSLTDNLGEPRKYVFPVGSPTLPAGGYLVVWCDDDASAPGIHTGFSFSSSGESAALYSAGGQLLDSVTFGLQAADLTIGRIPNGTGGFALNPPTPALANQVQTLASPVGALKFNEWMASPSKGDDWLEVYNLSTLPVQMDGMVITDGKNATGVHAITNLCFIGPDGYAQFFASDMAKTNAENLPFKLGASGETLTLYAADRATIVDRVVFGAQLSGISEGRLPDGNSGSVAAFTKPTPAASNFLPIDWVVINEVLTHTDPPLEDAVELHNLTATNVPVGNWWISNSKSDVKKYRIPANTVIPANGYVVFYEYQFDADDSGQSPYFRFNSARGDECYLHTGDAAGNLTGYRQKLTLPSMQNGVSYGRFQTTSGFDYGNMAQRTFGVDNPVFLGEFRQGSGKANVGPLVGPIVLSEVMYHPYSVPPDDNTVDEYIELANMTSIPVPMYDPDVRFSTNTWRLRGAVEFDFPRQIMLGAGEKIVVVSFDPAVDTALAASFRSRFAVPSNVRVVGPMKGKLSNASDTVELYKPDPPQLPPHPDAGIVPYIFVDRLEYADTLPWPADADGKGQSLTRINLSAFGNDVNNWKGASPTPGFGAVALVRPTLTVTPETGFISLAFSVQPGGTYWLEVSDNPSPDADWQVADGPWNTVSAAQVSTTQTVDEGARARFYRVRVDAE